jgi:hypothetical protein
MVKQNKNECTQLMEQTYELLNAILMVHINSETGVGLPPSVLTHIGKFTKYVALLRKIKPPHNEYCYQDPLPSPHIC